MERQAEIFFEDFTIGDSATYGDMRVSAEAIVAFAREFDPQPFHVDEQAAKKTFAGELIASGWHTNAMLHRMNCDFFLNRSSCIGSPGIEEVKWLRPVHPGDRLSVRRTVVDVVPSRSKPDRGMVRLTYDLFNGEQTHLCHHDGMVLFLRRNPGPAVAPAGDAAAGRTGAAGRGAGEHQPSDVPQDLSATLPFFEDIEIGAQRQLGQYAFDQSNIERFARAYDNQGFHIDPVIAANGPYGGIIASGWHTASAWMVTMVHDCASRQEAARKSGLPVARLGVSPGFKQLHWLKPVRPGDVLTYFTMPVEKRVSSSRPEWGLVSSQNWALNQWGERVFSYVSSVFWGCRRP